jgi:hypothetical protein
LIAGEGCFPALWQTNRDSDGHALSRYAYILTDESARLNPSLHGRNSRTNPLDWDGGPGDLPLTNASGTLLSDEEAESIRKDASRMPTHGSLEQAFADPERFAAMKSLLTRDPCLLPDLIPAGYPEGGLPKYNLNDLATNPLWGPTPYDRATNIAAIIDRNLPTFRFRDPSLPSKEAPLYTRRLVCSIVDYISPQVGPTGPVPSEPIGRDLVPYVTQIAECCTLTARTSNSATSHDCARPSRCK